MKGHLVLQRSITKWAQKKPHAPAIIETKTGEHITYTQLATALTHMGPYLGNKPLTVMVSLPGGIIDAVVWLASLTYGHTIIPVSPALTEEEYTALITQYTPDLILTETTQRTLHKSIKQRTADDCQQIMMTTNSAKEIAYSEGKVLLSTSGSTGEPKGIILSATKLVITAENIIKSHCLTPDDRGLTPLPFHHVNAPVVSLLTAVLSGGSVVIAPKYSTTHFWEWVKTYNPTWISIVPTIAAMLLTTECPDFLKNSSLKFIRTASAPLPVITLKRFEKKFHLPLIETYGITEAGSTITANPVPPGEHKPGSAGLPIGISLQITDSITGKKLPQGKIGEVWIKGSQVITAYIGNRDGDSFRNRWFKTGDLGYVDQDGYVFLTGRKKEIIIRGGENISPREIEEVLLTYPHVQEAAVVGLSDPIYGEQVAAFVVLNNTKQEQLADKLRTYAIKKLSQEKVPATFYILDHMPRGRTGKIDKKLLKTYNSTT